MGILRGFILVILLSFNSAFAQCEDVKTDKCWKEFIEIIGEIIKEEKD